MEGDERVYHVEICVPLGPDDFEWQECECGCGQSENIEYVKRHAKEIVQLDGAVRVCDDNGTEIWHN